MINGDAVTRDDWYGIDTILLLIHNLYRGRRFVPFTCLLFMSFPLPRGLIKLTNEDCYRGATFIIASQRKRGERKE